MAVEEAAASSVVYTWCANDGTDSSYAEALDVEAMERRISASGCPNYARSEAEAAVASVARQDFDLGVPLFPHLGTVATTAASEAEGGAATRGVLRSGVALYDTWDASAAAIWPSADACGGYLLVGGGGGGEYLHYSSSASNPSCLTDQLASESESGHSAQVGWAVDGFPYYGAMGLGGVAMKRCGAVGADATLCLDECHGWEGELVGVDPYHYRYYSVTGEEEVESAAHCLRGCVAYDDPEAEVAAAPRRVPTCSAGSEAGYVDGFVPGKLEAPGVFEAAAEAVAEESAAGAEEEGAEGAEGAEEGEDGSGVAAEAEAASEASSKTWVTELVSLCSITYAPRTTLRAPRTAHQRQRHMPTTTQNVTDTDLDQNNWPVKNRVHCYYVDPTAGTDGTTRRVCHMTDGTPGQKGR